MPLPYVGSRLHRLALVRLRATRAACQRAHALTASEVREFPNPHPGPNPFAWDCESETYALASHFAYVYSWKVAQESAARLAGNRGLAEELLFGDRQPDMETADYARFRRLFADTFAQRPDSLLCHRSVYYWRDAVRSHNEAYRQRRAAQEADWRMQVRRCPTPSGFYAAEMPWIGDDIVHPVIGLCRVTHMLFFESGAPGVRSPFYHDHHWRPVAVGPRGSALVHPGQWEAAPDTAPDVAVPDGSALVQEFGADGVYPCPEPAAPVPAPKPGRMPNLFEESYA